MDPHYRPWSFVVKASLVMLPLFGALPLFVKDGPVFITFVFGFIWLWLLYKVIKGKKDGSLDERLYHVRPLLGPNCPLCGGLLRFHPERRCMTCNVLIDTSRPVEPPPYDIEKFLPLPPDQFVPKLHDAICSMVPMETEAEECFVTLYEFDARMQLSGFEVYFHHHAPRHFHEVLRCLRTVGDERRATVFQSSMRIFTAGKLPEDLEEYENFVHALSPEQKAILDEADTAYAALESDLNKLLKDYVVANIAQFKPQPAKT